MPKKTRWQKSLACACLSLSFTSSWAESVTPSSFISESPTSKSLDRSRWVIHLGAFQAEQGKAQQVGIEGLEGDDFTVNSHPSQQGLLGLGYYLNGFERDTYRLWYGLDAYYLSPSTVSGEVIQEQSFTNLSYRYSIANYPVYAATKLWLKGDGDYDVTLDAGVGPNWIKTYGFSETPLNDNALPDSIFSGQTSVALSATAGIGVTFHHVLGDLPLECSYRFFYLGQGKLHVINDQVNQALTTGYSYANALMLSIAF